MVHPKARKIFGLLLASLVEAAARAMLNGLFPRAKAKGKAQAKKGAKGARQGTQETGDNTA